MRRAAANGVTAVGSPALQERVWPLACLAVVCLCFAGWVAVSHAAQLPLDLYSFRQSQTALTAYWLKINGFALDYETPVAGPPWSIPFEFPIYQAIVALVSRATGSPLDATGRLVSFAALLGCLPPMLAITRRLRLAPAVFPIFCALMLSSPTYVYWGRSFMIETTALFFCVVALRFFVDLVASPARRRNAACFALFMSLGILQKATTGLPILVVLCGVFVCDRVARAPSARTWLRSGEARMAALCFGIPLLVGLAWTIHADRIKSLNPFAAAALTTDALRGWNLGTVAQRFTADLWRDVLWKEILDKNCGGLAGIALLAIGLAVRPGSRATRVIVVSLVLGTMPMLVFTNLHIVHSYYQTANVVFFLFAIAVALGDVIARRVRGRLLVPVVATVLAASNVSVFFAEYAQWVAQTFPFDQSREAALGAILKAHVPRDAVFVAFDFSWTSSLAYLSERKSFTVSDQFPEHVAMRKDPTRFIDPARLGAVVACPDTVEPIDDFLAWSVDRRSWAIGRIDGCYVALPERVAIESDAAARPTGCSGLAGSLERVTGSDRLAVVGLRTARVAGTTYFVTTGAAHRPLLDLGDPSDDAAATYSRLIAFDDPRDLPAPRLRRVRDGRLDDCGPVAMR